MQTVRDIAPYAALGAAALSLVLLVLVLVMWRSVRRLRRSQLVVMGRHDQRDIVQAVESLDSQVRNLREAAEILTDQLDEHKAHLDRALTNRGIVRYDAFRDAGGEQSASFALLDNYRSGVVFSAIAARDFARIYVKHLTEGVPDRELSPEEVQAVAAAVPRPLRPGEEGARSLRAPQLAGMRPPSAGGEAAGEGGPAADTAGDAGPAAGGASALQQAGSDPARRAFDALADAGAAGEPFAWEPGPRRASDAAGGADAWPEGSADASAPPTPGGAPPA